MNALIVYI